MWSHLSPSKNYRRAISTKLSGLGGVKFLVASVLVSLSVPMVLSAYGVVSRQSPMQSSAESTAAEHPEETTQSTVETNQTTPTPESQAFSSSDNSNSSSDTRIDTNLRVNDESIKVPENGTVHRTIRNNGGKTSVDVSTKSNTTQSGSSSSHMTIEMNTVSDSETDIDIREEESEW